MCTVSYLPLKPDNQTGRDGGYILTSNRDESPRRNAIEILRLERKGTTLLYPADPEAGGTWFCISNFDRAACLLNGAYEPFIRHPRFTHSRGLMLLDLIQHPTIEDFTGNYDFSATAPFTAVVAEGNTLDELIWDGTTLTHHTMNPRIPSFWSSVTLYPEDVRTWRKALFTQWLTTHQTFDQIEIMDFHRYGSGDNGWNGFVMNREERVKTLSISSVKKLPGVFNLVHIDLTSGRTFRESLELSPTHV